MVVVMMIWFKPMTTWESIDVVAVTGEPWTTTRSPSQFVSLFLRCFCSCRNARAISLAFSVNGICWFFSWASLLLVVLVRVLIVVCCAVARPAAEDNDNDMSSSLFLLRCIVINASASLDGMIKLSGFSPSQIDVVASNQSTSYPTNNYHPMGLCCHHWRWALSFSWIL